MNYEYLFLFSMFLNNLLFCWNFALLDSLNFWRKKWEDEVNKDD